MAALRMPLRGWGDLEPPGRWMMVDEFLGAEHHTPFIVQFDPAGDVPVRWIEAQAPKPTPRHGTLFVHDRAADG